jgi:hypothetical protein
MQIFNINLLFTVWTAEKQLHNKYATQCINAYNGMENDLKN